MYARLLWQQVQQNMAWLHSNSVKCFVRYGTPPCFCVAARTASCIRKQVRGVLLYVVPNTAEARLRLTWVYLPKLSLHCIL